MDDRWSATLLGAALLRRDGSTRACRCARGTCDRCLARLRKILPSRDAALKAFEIAIALDAALDAEAEARLAGEPLTAECYRAEARAAVARLSDLGVDVTRGAK